MIQANGIVPCVTCMFCSNKLYWYEYHIDFTHVASANEMIRPAIMVRNIRSNHKYTWTGLESQRNKMCEIIWTSFENKGHLSMHWPSHYKGNMVMRLSFNDGNCHTDDSIFVHQARVFSQFYKFSNISKFCHSSFGTNIDKLNGKSYYSK